jgi:alpha-methylacyl-CoA racemase
VSGAPAPLEGVRVLDLSRLLPGGFCSLLLADFGADVVKVEDTGMGDYVRWAPPAFEGADDTAKGALFLALNRGKRSVRLDLKTDGGREALLRLARDADVLLESFRPGVLDRLGVGWDVLHEANPGLVYCAITGYGQTGPLRSRSGHDLNYLGLNGVLALTGEADGPPVQAGGQIADLGGGALMAAFGILTALRHRDRTGEGQLVDVSMFDGALSWLAMVAARVFAAGDRPRRGHEQLGGSLLCYRPYRCADGWVTLGALEPKFWRAWCAGVGREDLVERQFEPPGSAAHAEVGAIFAGRTRAAWEAFAAEHDCCLEPVLELEEALDSELVRAREMVLSFEQPGAGAVRGLGFPVKLSATPGAVRRGGPALGEHTREVLAAAGYDDEALDRLEAEGAIAGAAGGDAAGPAGPSRSFLA